MELNNLVLGFINSRVLKPQNTLIFAQEITIVQPYDEQFTSSDCEQK